MPFTPFHFGPHACVSLPFRDRLDVPVFLGANVAVDIEPLLVLVGNLDYPLHGYCHTLLGGGLVGLLFAAAAYPARRTIAHGMQRIGLPYAPAFLKMAAAGVLGAWLHVLLDALLYAEMNPFYPLATNPLHGYVSAPVLYALCAACLVPALVIYARVRQPQRP